MNKITINTGLDSFVLLDRITDIGSLRIEGTKHFSHDPIFLGIESLAQLGAFHVRYITGLEKHAFLLKITRLSELPRQVLNGRYMLNGSLFNHSGMAFSYLLEAKKENKALIKGEFLFATVDYGHSFKKEILQNHYQKVFSCLQHGSKINYYSSRKPACIEIPLPSQENKENISLSITTRC